MDLADFDAAIDRDGRAVLAAAKGGLDAPVSACPGWSVADVVGHVARTHRSVTEIIESRAIERPTSPIPAAPSGLEVLEFFEQGLDGLLAALASAEPETPLYTWAPPHNVGFYCRRMAHELAIHRFDVEAAHGVADPFDPEMATDAISELFELLLPFVARRTGRPLPTSTLHVHRTDGPGEWLVRADGGEVVVTHEHAKGDVAVRGSASDLLMFLWNRGRTDALEVFGEEAAATAWAALAP